MRVDMTGTTNCMLSRFVRNAIKTERMRDVAKQREGGIAWTEETWNPIRGCSRVSEGCRHCYAETVANRFKGPGQPYEGLIAPGGQWNGNITVAHNLIDQPLRWKKPRRIFVNSMSDLFHENVDDYIIRRVFDVMAQCPQHTFQILTKRPERMQQLLSMWERIGITGDHFKGKPLPNVWLGVSVEDQTTADERIPLLLETPAAVRWISAEPLLGPIKLTWEDRADGMIVDKFPLLDWVVVGGESGQGARPMHPQWARDLRDQCQAAGVPFFMKQICNRGRKLPFDRVPIDLQIREYPQ